MEHVVSIQNKLLITENNLHQFRYRYEKIHLKIDEIRKLNPRKFMSSSYITYELPQMYPATHIKVIYEETAHALIQFVYFYIAISSISSRHLIETNMFI